MPLACLPHRDPAARLRPPSAPGLTPSGAPRGPSPGPSLGLRGRAGGLLAALGMALGLPAAGAAAEADSPGREAARVLAGALLQVQGSRRDGEVLNEGLSSGMLWPHAACPGRYALTVRHGVNAVRPGPDGSWVHAEDRPPLGARVRFQAARRAGQPPAGGEATVIAVGEGMGGGQDWALLRLDQALPERAWPVEGLARQPPRPGQALRLLALPADALAPGPEPRAALEAPCRVTEADPELQAWRSSCRGAAGQSGGPVLFGPVGGADGTGWQLGGLVVARRKAPGQAKAVFLSLPAIAPAVNAAIAADAQGGPGCGAAPLQGSGPPAQDP